MNKTKKVKIGSLTIGGGERIAVQSMTNTDTHDFDACYRQVRALETEGCDIIRLAVPDLSAVSTIARLKEAGIKAPLVADIHFDYRIAIECANAGVDKIRINPGNIGSDDKVKAVAKICNEKNIPIRIGVNSGSLEKSILERYGAPTAEALAESALYHASLLEKFDFDNIVLSVKSPGVKTMIDANRILSGKVNYPLHLGVTEAGTETQGLIKSSAGIGSLLCDGIGDTIRISLTADPVSEVKSAKALLKAIGRSGANTINIVSCPTCGRTQIDLIDLVHRFEEIADTRLKVSKPITVALMGCVVNGPGEAREADIGIAGGKGEALLFKKGTIIRKIPEELIIETLIREIEMM
jgi:(E)-4-hydroxy-3-methylbut-2-enyl-diphosphate synthase